MNYNNNICFSSTPAEALNAKAFALDKRLYLFAHYEPKPYLAGETFRSQFMTASINLYGLFQDCCPFLRQIINRNGGILLGDWPNFSELLRVSKALRSIFCHNNSKQLRLNLENYKIVEWWMKRKCQIYCDFDDLQESDWEVLLQKLTAMADTFERDLSKGINDIFTWSNQNQTAIIDRWVEAIAKSYLINPEYLLNALTAMYVRYMNFYGYSLHLNPPLRNQTIEWIEALRSAAVNNVTANNNGSTPVEIDWKEKWLDKPPRQVRQSKVYALLLDWPNQWAARNGSTAAQCDEAPMPGSSFLRILAKNVDEYVAAPYLDYNDDDTP